MGFIKIILITLYSTWILASPDKLKMKQTASNLRFLSQKGDITYFSQRSGTLHLTSNYTKHTVLKSKPFAQFTITFGEGKKKLLIEQDDSYQETQSLLKNNTLYSIEYGGYSPTEIGKGKAPQLHLNDSWYSFFNPRLKEITFGKFQGQIIYKKEILNPYNPYFIPQRLVLNEKLFAYTDMNEKGYPAIIYFEADTKKITSVFKAQKPNTKLELCRYKNNLYIGEFSLYDSNAGSSIYSVDLNKSPRLETPQLIYQSNLNDIGQLQCDEQNLYFVKTYKEDLNYFLKETDAVSLDIQTKKIARLSQFETLTQILLMEGNLLSLFQGEYYVLKGQSDFTQDQLSSDKKETSNEDL